jgi:hypothetical protein
MNGNVSNSPGKGSIRPHLFCPEKKIDGKYWNSRSQRVPRTKIIFLKMTSRMNFSSFIVSFDIPAPFHKMTRSSTIIRTAEDVSIFALLFLDVKFILFLFRINKAKSLVGIYKTTYEHLKITIY